MIVSTTERGSYKRCRRQWQINSRSRWGMTRIVPNNALGLGTLVHSTLGIWLEMHKSNMSLPDGGLSAIFTQYADEAIKEARAVYEKQVGANMTDSELAPLLETVAQGRCMMDNYQQRWGTPIPAGFEIIATEQRCIVPIPGTEHTSEWIWFQPDPLYQPYVWEHKQVVYPDVRLHYLEGKLDAILRETRTGKLFVLEHKTYGQRPREDVLFTTDQFLSYHLILLHMAGQMGLDPRLVAGVAYDGLWKRAAPPKTVDGHTGTLQDLFCRRLITRPHQELAEFEQEVAMELLEMANNPPIYKNRTSDGSCFWGCSDNHLCLQMSRGEDFDYTLTSQYKRKEPDEDMDASRDVA